MEQQVEILLIEDSEYDAELTFKAMKVKMPSINYHHIRDGQEAMDYLLKRNAYAGKHDNLPLLILLDLDIPRVAGLRVLEELKTDELTKSIPVVVLTISQDIEKMKRAYLLGANSFIIKPVSFVKFTLAIADVVHYWLFVNEYPGYQKFIS